MSTSDPAAIAGGSASNLGNPFVGPRPFEAGRPLFGRDREVAGLYDLLSAERIVLLHSPSGAGKSSLIHAGLIPLLSERFDVWGPTRVNLHPPAAATNRYACSAMLGFEQQIAESRRRTQDQIAAMTLSEYAQTRPRKRSARSNVVLIFDQFEELLTIDPIAVEAKRDFFRQLGALLQDPRYWVLFALREDHLAPFDSYASEVPTHLRNRFRLDLLNRDTAREAIAKPARMAGREFTPKALDKLVNDLAKMNVQQPDGAFREQPGLHVEPLQLQVVCRSLWESMPPDDSTIDPKDVATYGDVTNALAIYYAAEIKRISAGDKRLERTIREWIGSHLITAGSIRGQVLRGPGKTEGLDNDLIAKLIDTHLVRAEQRGGSAWYELAHDRLIEPVGADNDRWHKENLNFVQRRAALWELQGRPAELLLPQSRISEGKKWLASGYGEIERGFVEESLKALAAAELERQRTSRLRWLSVAAIVFGLFGLTAGVTAYFAERAAVKAKEAAEDAGNQAKQAKERTVKELVETSWIAADFLSYQVAAPADTVQGTRTLYNSLFRKMDPIINLRKMQSLSAPISIFVKGPHADNYNFQSYEFGHYNPVFTRWAAARLIPTPDNSAFRKIAQNVYNRYLLELTRVYYLSYKFLQGNPDLAKRVLDQYRADLDAFRGKPWAPSILSGPGGKLQMAFYEFSDGLRAKQFSWDRTQNLTYTAATAPGFWIRRRIDGTESDWHEMMMKLLTTYDKDWLQSPEAK
jgi:hypothetical protein